jgi:hypothetical protein
MHRRAERAREPGGDGRLKVLYQNQHRVEPSALAGTALEGQKIMKVKLNRRSSNWTRRPLNSYPER